MPGSFPSILLHWRSLMISWTFSIVLFLQQKFYDNEDLFIVGLAASYTEAVDMVVAMTEKVVRETGGRGYQKIYSGAQISRS